MRRREFITLVGGAAAAWPLAARAQQSMRHVTIWMGRANDAEGLRLAAAFVVMLVVAPVVLLMKRSMQFVPNSGSST